MIKRYSIEEARANLDGVVQEAEDGTQVELTRQGKPVAVLVGLEAFERLSKKKPGFWEAYQEFRRKADLRRLIPTRSSAMFGIRLPGGTSTCESAFPVHVTKNSSGLDMKRLHL